MNISDITGILPDPRRFELSDVFVLPYQKVGIEVEIEATNIAFKKYLEWKPKYWVKGQDGSLRLHGLEPKFKYGMFGKDILGSLDELEDWIESCPDSSLVLSDRCSLHVHLDTSDWSIEKLRGVILLFLVYEPLLFKAYGDGRQRNNFCFAYFNDSKYRNNCLRTVLKCDYEVIGRALSRHNKYTSLNLSRMVDHVENGVGLGTIEFRLHKGCVDKSEITHYINILMSLVKAAGDGIDVTDTLQKFSGEGPLDSTLSIFGDHAEKMVKIHDFYDLFYKGLRSMQDLEINFEDEFVGLVDEDILMKNSPFLRKMKEKKKKKPSVKKEVSGVDFD